MSSNPTLGTETRALTTKRERDADAGEAFPRLPNHLVVTHILRSEHFDDPADLARLPAVSRAMSDAVAETGLRFKELGEAKAIELGCLSALQPLQRGVRLSRQERLCEAAAKGGHLEVLQWLRADGCLWNKYTCWEAAKCGHLEVLQWAHANGCLWDWHTCANATGGGHLEVLQWLRANGCPWDKYTVICARDRDHVELVNWAIAKGCPE